MQTAIDYFAETKLALDQSENIFHFTSFQTPWGYTLRYRPLDAGIYWVETDQCVEVLVVRHPIWGTEF